MLHQRRSARRIAAQGAEDFPEVCQVLFVRDVEFVWFVLRNDFLEYFAGDIWLSQTKSAQEVGALFGLG